MKNSAVSAITTYRILTKISSSAIINTTKSQLDEISKETGVDIIEESLHECALDFQHCTYDNILAFITHVERYDYALSPCN